MVYIGISHLLTKRKGGERMRVRRKILRKVSSNRNSFLYFIHIPPMWARENYPGEVELVFLNGSIIITPQKEAEK